MPARIDAGGERGRGPWSLLVAVFVLVLVAIVKPWAGGGPATGAGGSGPGPLEGARAELAPPPSPSPEPTLSPDELAIARCNAPLGWRTYAWETWRGGTIRHFIALEPLAATS